MTNHVIIMCVDCKSVVSGQIPVSSIKKMSEADADRIVDAYLDHEYSQPGFEGHMVYWKKVKEIEVIPMEVEA